MAGRYVVIEFDDPQSAEAFVKNTNIAAHLAFKPIAMLMKPMSFCQCPDKRRQDVKNWARGRRTGLWLCKRCKKPSTFHTIGLMERLQYVFGNNLLEVKEEFRG